MLNWYFYNTFIRRCHWNFEKHKNLHFSKSKKTQNTGYIQNKRNGGTRNKHFNLLIYTVPFNRVLIERRYYNIQTIKYHNNAELIFLQHIFRRCQPRLWNFEKHKNLHFSKSKKHKIQGTYKTTKRGNQKYTTQSVDLHSPTRQSTDWPLFLQYSNNKVPQ